MTASDAAMTPRTEMDHDRSSLSSRDIFAPFRVSAYRLLRDCLSGGVVSPTAPALLNEGPSDGVVLLTPQMAYHHVAQGEIEGHKWMVSF